ncbi:MAG: hypothetical protein E7462_00925 [Ruminococcaceae bacterium]|nr:hypothetical protein [Oscillospiraceae bacterium]
MENEVNEWETVSIVISYVGCFLFLVGFVKAVSFFLDFTKEMRYLNLEIRRTLGSEQRYWKWKRRRLWLSILPFIKYDYRR